MASVVELRPRAREDFTSSLGMIVFLASWAMMFGGLFFAYAFIRSAAVSWPPPGVPRLPIGLPSVNTLVMLASSATLVRGIRLVRRGERAALSRWVLATIALGALFLGLQLVVWRDVAEQGLSLSTGHYGSVFYALTMFHALHVLVGLGLLSVILVQSRRGRYSEHNNLTVRLCAMFWHFVDAVWLLMFLAVYLF